jgi:hypothetical protein
LPRWEPYDPGRDNLLHFGDTITVDLHWRSDALDFLDRYYDAAS